MKTKLAVIIVTILVAASLVALANIEAEGGNKVVKTASGLQYEDVVVGKGASPRTGDLVVVHYTGTLTDGQKFDSSVDRGQPFEFRIGMGNVIKGWDEGVASMKVGGKRKLTIPSSLAYGDKGITSGGKVIIPGKATLLFDVELLNIKK
ncbi:MAG: FKBP-type peptidyl-prolyl cis-trans isomerase [Candidatus Eremiobacteraeota bacterium]|nr:FKBP-type peptidyl-prolyl cis-trans isomerase [Candidatus Eremiobacteraeota bacterium]